MTLMARYTSSIAYSSIKVHMNTVWWGHVMSHVHRRITNRNQCYKKFMFNVYRRITQRKERYKKFMFNVYRRITQRKERYKKFSHYRMVLSLCLKNWSLPNNRGSTYIFVFNLSIEIHFRVFRHTCFGLIYLLKFIIESRHTLMRLIYPSKFIHLWK